VSPEGSRSLFLFEVAAELFAIDPASVRQVAPLPLLSRPPGTPPLLHGFLDLAGEAIPVLNLRRLFGLADADAEADFYAHLMIVKRPGIPLALLVDRALGLASAGSEAITPVSRAQTFNDCADQMVTLGGRTAYLISLERLLLQEEQGRVAELRGIEQRRLQQLADSPP
jgi:purine-binding chemotaxis protein CheW